MVAQYLGVKPPAEDTTAESGSAEDLMRAFGGIGGNIVMGRVDLDLEPQPEKKAEP